MKVFIKVFTVALIIFGSSFTIIYFDWLGSKICDERVTMKDGRVFNCAETVSNQSLTIIKGCDGSRIGVPTNDIKIIETLKSE